MIWDKLFFSGDINLCRQQSVHTFCILYTVNDYVLLRISVTSCNIQRLNESVNLSMLSNYIVLYRPMACFESFCLFTLILLLPCKLNKTLSNMATNKLTKYQLPIQAGKSLNNITIRKSSQTNTSFYKMFHY